MFDPVSPACPHPFHSQRFQMARVVTASSVNPVVLDLQSKRISAKDALAHPYLDEGRLRYHTCMCKCCYTTSSGRVYTSDFEPVTNPKFDDGFEKNLSSVRQVKGQSHRKWCAELSLCFSNLSLALVWRLKFVSLSEIIHQFILEQQKGSRVPLCINPQSAAFKSFIRYEVPEKVAPQSALLHLLFIWLRVVKLGDK